MSMAIGIFELGLSSTNRVLNWSPFKSILWASYAKYFKNDSALTERFTIFMQGLTWTSPIPSSSSRMPIFWPFGVATEYSWKGFLPMGSSAWTRAPATGEFMRPNLLLFVNSNKDSTLSGGIYAVLEKGLLLSVAMNPMLDCCRPHKAVKGKRFITTSAHFNLFSCESPRPVIVTLLHRYTYYDYSVPSQWLSGQYWSRKCLLIVICHTTEVMHRKFQKFTGNYLQARRKGKNVVVVEQEKSQKNENYWTRTQLLHKQNEC